MTATSTRRAVLAGAAAIPALSLPVIAQSDPIFAAIKRHREAESAYVTTCYSVNPETQTRKEVTALEEHTPTAARRWRGGSLLGNRRELPHLRL